MLYNNNNIILLYNVIIIILTTILPKKPDARNRPPAPSILLRSFASTGVRSCITWGSSRRGSAMPEARSSCRTAVGSFSKLSMSAASVGIELECEKSLHTSQHATCKHISKNDPQCKAVGSSNDQPQPVHQHYSTSTKRIELCDHKYQCSGPTPSETGTPQ